MINQRYRNLLKDARAYTTADCGSDHNPVICKIKIRLKNLTKKSAKSKNQYKYGTEKVSKIHARLRTAALGWHRTSDAESKWINIKSSLLSARDDSMNRRLRSTKMSG